MKHIFFLAPLLILLICGSACTSMKGPAPTPPPISTDLKAQISTDLKAQLKTKLDVARYELQLYEEELKATKEEIRQAEARNKPSPSLLNWENELKEKIIQSKVKIRELETVLNEKQKAN
jgi:hypothetical protein